MDLNVILKSLSSDRPKWIDKNTSNKNMKPPTSQKEVHQFIGVVKYYRGISARRSHTLASLTKIMSCKASYLITHGYAGTLVHAK